MWCICTTCTALHDMYYYVCSVYTQFFHHRLNVVLLLLLSCFVVKNSTVLGRCSTDAPRLSTTPAVCLRISKAFSYPCCNGFLSSTISRFRQRSLDTTTLQNPKLCWLRRLDFDLRWVHRRRSGRLGLTTGRRVAALSHPPHRVFLSESFSPLALLSILSLLPAPSLLLHSTINNFEF